MAKSLPTEDDIPSSEPARSIKIITVGGGKGGIGKTLVSSSLAIALAEAGTRVVLVDADLGGANVHTVMGIHTPEKTLHDFISRKVKALSDVIIPSPIHGLQLICGAAGSIGMANMEYADKLKLIRHFRRLLAEFVIVDIGAGMSLNEVDLFNAGDIQIVVANPEPTSIQECYNFIKVAIFRRLRREFADTKEVLEVLDRSKDPSHVHDRRLLTEIGEQVKQVDLREGVRFFRLINAFTPKLILNRVHDYRETLEGLALQIATQDLLRLRLDFWGYMSYDPYIAKAVRAMRPGEILAGDSENRDRFLKMVQQYLLGQNVHYRSIGTRTILPIVDQQPTEKKEGRICSQECPLWQNCELQEGGLPCRMPDHMYRERLGGNLLTAGK
ncbi:AAA family ATPase [candidate division KSB1 bacterium]|nr:AAA family ATPase [candidate division KSB1 bacterium]